jgi:hypothetical protein
MMRRQILSEIFETPPASNFGAANELASQARHEMDVPNESFADANCGARISTNPALF